MIPPRPHGEAPGRLRAVAAADDLVRVAHRHERDAGPRRRDPLDQLEAPSSVAPA